VNKSAHGLTQRPGIGTWFLLVWSSTPEPLHVVCVYYLTITHVIPLHTCFLQVGGMEILRFQSHHQIWNQVLRCVCTTDSFQSFIIINNTCFTGVAPFKSVYLVICIAIHIIAIHVVLQSVYVHILVVPSNMWNGQWWRASSEIWLTAISSDDPTQHQCESDVTDWLQMKTFVIHIKGN